MNGVIGMIQLLEDSDLDRRQREYAEVIRSSADALLVVINDLLDYAKIEAGKLELERVEMDLAAHVEEVATSQAATAAAKDLELIVDLDPDLAQRVLGDPGRLRQALSNLVSNAIKFTKAGGRIGVSARRTGAQIALSVEDTGMGIPEEDAKRVFDTFVRGKDKHGRPAGAGLGLALVRQIARRHKGDAAIEATAGGTAFVVPGARRRNSRRWCPGSRRSRGRCWSLLGSCWLPRMLGGCGAPPRRTASYPAARGTDHERHRAPVGAVSP